jgi:2-dehydropantoate 2-reductase
MRVLMLGAGAVGGYYGARLLQGGADVTFLVRPGRLEQLAGRGLRIEGLGERTRVAVSAVTRAPSTYDTVILACKAYDLDAAIEAIAPAVGAGTTVLPLMNGVAQLDVLDARFGRARVAGGSCHLIASLDAEGTIQRLADVERIVYGVREGNGANRRMALERLHAALERAGVSAVLSPDVMQEMWDKYVLLCSFAAITCLMRASVGDIARTAAGRDIAREIVDTCVGVAEREGHPPAPQVLAGIVEWVTARDSLLTASMLRDMERGARIEGEHIVGDMLRRAQAAGIEARLLSAAHCHLQAYESRRQRERAAGS